MNDHAAKSGGSRGPEIEKLVDTSSPRAVLEEVLCTATLIDQDFDQGLLTHVFDDVVSLFEGRYPGYRACNTPYHDLKHTTDVFLAMAALMHGGQLAGAHVDRDSLRLGLIAALMHDTGYIQERHDTDGTGAKYILDHVERSIEFIEKYFSMKDFPKKDLSRVSRMVSATSENIRIDEIPFFQPSDSTVGLCLRKADLLGQMADRMYLERLLLLYQEFLDAGYMRFQSEEDLLENTPGFIEMVIDRLMKEEQGATCNMRMHFRRRWEIDDDIYVSAAMRNRLYIDRIISDQISPMRSALKRGGIVEMLEREYSAS